MGGDCRIWAVQQGQRAMENMQITTNSKGLIISEKLFARLVKRLQKGLQFCYSVCGPWTSSSYTLPGHLSEM